MSLTTGPRRVFAVLSVVLLVELVWALTQSSARRSRAGAGQPRRTCRRCAQIGIALFTDYSFAFEVTSVLILVAMVGAVVLAEEDRSEAA